jgi:HD-GYP domain-containing protein (c-di-GMP phosphodiesterase class II)
MACIISVADTFDAMTTHRPYQTAMDPGVAIEYIQSFAGKKYDPDVSAALAAAFADGDIKMTRAATMV